MTANHPIKNESRTQPRETLRAVVRAVPGGASVLRRVDATWTRWRRWRLLSAYAAAERDGLLELDDGAVKWKWPDDE